MRDLVIVVDHVEDDTSPEGKPFKRVIDKQGDKHRVSQQLESKWYLLKDGETLKLTMDTFAKDGKTFEYVKDVEKVQDVFVREAAAKVAQQKSLKDISIEAQATLYAITNLLVAGKKDEVDKDTLAMYKEWKRRALTEALK